YRVARVTAPHRQQKAVRWGGCSKTPKRGAARAAFRAFARKRGRSARGLQRTRAKDLRAHAHVGCAKGHRGLEVRAHAHAELSQSKLVRELGKKSKMHRRLFVQWRNAHEPRDVEVEVLATEPQQSRRLLRIDASLLRLRTRVDLDEQLEPPL